MALTHCESRWGVEEVGMGEGSEDRKGVGRGVWKDENALHHTMVSRSDWLIPKSWHCPLCAPAAPHCAPPCSCCAPVAPNCAPTFLHACRFQQMLATCLTAPPLLLTTFFPQAPSPHLLGTASWQNLSAAWHCHWPKPLTTASPPAVRGHRDPLQSRFIETPSHRIMRGWGASHAA